MKKSKKIIFVLLSCFVLAFSFLIPTFLSDSEVQVKADNITYDYTFTSSNLLAVAATWYNNGSGASRTGFVLPSFVITTTSSSKSLKVTAPVYTEWSSGSGSYDTLNSTTTNLSTSRYDWNVHCVTSTQNYIPFRVKLSSSDFIANIYKIRIYSESTSSWNFTTHIIYYDVNDNYIDIEICNWQSASVGNTYFHNFMYSDRTYYLSTALSEDANYQAGYDAGYQIGSSDGQDIGYTNGYTAGQTAGYGSGYTAGQNDANNYTFFNLFGAVLDAPVSVLMNILNFQLLGVNLWALFTGLLTLAILILVIKLILGGK